MYELFLYDYNLRLKCLMTQSLVVVWSVLLSHIISSSSSYFRFTEREYQSSSQHERHFEDVNYWADHSILEYTCHPRLRKCSFLSYVSSFISSYTYAHSHGHTNSINCPPFLLILTNLHLSSSFLFLVLFASITFS